jgi:Mg2+ and Co2+ transporter CorA
MQDEAIQKGMLPSPFIVVRDIYRIIASEWIVVNTCYQRELGSIEWNLGNGDFKLKHLQEYLHSMYHARRRVNLYSMLVKEAKDACKLHGRKAWSRDLDAKELEAVESVAGALETDFDYVASLLEKNQERIAKNISLLVALTSVAESRTAISNGSRIEALTVAAIVFLPFSLVSSVMNISGDLAPGEPRHYVFWAVSGPFSMLLMILYLLYSRSWSSD